MAKLENQYLNVLWITPVILPDVSRYLNLPNSGSGGWLGAMASLIGSVESNIRLSVLTLYNGSSEESFCSNGVKYYLIPDMDSVFQDNKVIKESLRNALEIIKPDLIDIQGIEFHYAKYISEVSGNVPVAATIQGLTSEIYKHYLGSISFFDLVRCRTMKDYLLFDGIFERRLKYRSRGVSELQTLRNVSYVIGRTFWDKSITKAINPNSNYYYSRRSVRNDFFEHSWSRDNIQPYTIFISQAHAPFKGFHILLEAAAIIKLAIPGLRILVAGRNMVDRSTINKKLRYGGYQKYIKYCISKYNLSDNVYFLGPLTSSEMAEKMCKSHVFILPSLVENSPNSLAEAQVIGVPSIAAFVGGIPDMIENNVTGFLYNSTDPAILAALVQNLFLDDRLAERISNTSRLAARFIYDNSNAVSELISCYSVIHEDYHKLN